MVMIILGSLGTALAITSIILQLSLPISLQLFYNLYNSKYFRNLNFESLPTISNTVEHKISRYVVHCLYKFIRRRNVSVPGPPASIKVVVDSQDTVVVSWLGPHQPNGEIVHYNIYVREVEYGREKSERSQQKYPIFAIFRRRGALALLFVVSQSHIVLLSSCCSAFQLFIAVY